MLVPRGNCTFETKAIHAQRLGAAGVVVYGTLASRYSLNTTKYSNHTDHVYTTDDIIYPQNLNDYDCDKGHAEIPSNTISMTPLPYNANQNDAILSGKDSLCYENSPDSLANCPSQSCLFTGTNTSSGDMLKACCAWDLHVWLYNDPTLSDDEPVVTIPAVYLTMQQGNFLLDQLKNGSVNAILYERYRPAYNPSAILIWGLGVFVAALAAYLSAGEYISARKQVERHAQNIASSPRGEEGRMASLDHAQMAYQRAPPVEETLELAVEHAFGFIVMASTGLFILFFFKVCQSILYLLYEYQVTHSCSCLLLDLQCRQSHVRHWLLQGSFPSHFLSSSCQTCKTFQDSRQDCVADWYRRLWRHFSI
jgi:hypothetical protein